MRIEDLTEDLLRSALGLYLRHAWPEREEQKMPRIHAGVRGADLLAGFTLKTRRAEEAAGPMRRYLLRLGNSTWIHMKFAFEEHLDRGRFLFAVDTHDDLPAAPNAPEEELERIRAIKEVNRELKSRIEAAWRKAGLPTLAGIAGPAPEETDKPGRGIRILVADDDLNIAAAVSAILTSKGFAVIVAHDGKEAVELAIRERPRIVLMDYEMPVMDGLKAAALIRQSLPASLTRIIHATASLMDLTPFIEEKSFLIKPYEKGLLISFLLAILRPDERKP